MLPLLALCILLHILFLPPITGAKRNRVDPPSLPNPEDKAHEPVLGYPQAGAPKWWDKFYLPMDSGGTSKVPMPDGLLIAQSQALRAAGKQIENMDAPPQSPDTDNAEKDNQAGENDFKPGTDDEYMAAKEQGTTSSVEISGEPSAEELEDEKLETDPNAYKLLRR
jgi:hypothetical protein